MVAPKEPKPGTQTTAAPSYENARSALGKLTRVQELDGGGFEVEVDGEQFLCAPSFEACFRGPPRLTKTLLDPLMGMSRAEVERRIQARIAAGQQQVCGTLPLGGVFFGTKASYEHARAVDEFQIQLRVIQNMETSLPAAIQAALMRLDGANDAHILAATDATVALTNLIGAIAKPAQDRDARNVHKPPSAPTTSAPLTPKAKVAPPKPGGTPPAPKPVAPATAKPKPPATKTAPASAGPANEVAPIRLQSAKGARPAYDPFEKVPDPVVVTVRFKGKLAKNAGEAMFFKAAIEWVQEAVQLRTGSRATDDAKHRREARVKITKLGVDVTGRDAAHPLDSIINVEFLPESGAYYFADQSVNRALGAQLQSLGKLPPGTPIRIEFQGFPDAKKVPPVIPPTPF
jgi:hypothetical protein